MARGQRTLNAEDALEIALTAAKRAYVTLGMEHLVGRLSSSAPWPECCPPSAPHASHRPKQF